jgi:hypothetical protein
MCRRNSQNQTRREAGRWSSSRPVKPAEFVDAQVFEVVPLVNEVADLRNHTVGRIAKRDQHRRWAAHLVNNGVIPAVPTAL